MKKEGIYAISTVQELAKYLAKDIKRGKVLHGVNNTWESTFPTTEFSVCYPPENMHTATEEELKEYGQECCGFYGIKPVDFGFDSDDLTVIVDYFGGGCATLCTITDFMDLEQIEKEIVDTVLAVINKGEGVDMSDLFLFCQIYKNDDDAIKETMIDK